MKLLDHFRKFCQMQEGKGLLLDTGKYWRFCVYVTSIREKKAYLNNSVK